MIHIQLSDFFSLCVSVFEYVISCVSDNKQHICLFYALFLCLFIFNGVLFCVLFCVVNVCLVLNIIVCLIVYFNIGGITSRCLAYHVVFKLFLKLLNHI